jgi:branched-subunit amino acid transport protein AzlD
MGAVIFFCRASPFLFFRDKSPSPGEALSAQRDEADPKAGTGPAASRRVMALLEFVEKVVPPTAMTVLAFNSVAIPFKDNPRLGLPALIAAVFTALVHLWKRNSLISIFGGTLVYMLILRFFFSG